jgi:tetratricopeptide (TPR) repeat protein
MRPCKTPARITYWLVAPDFIQTLTDGVYEIAISLDMGNSTNVASPGAPVQIQAEPPALSAEDETMKYLLLAQYARLAGQADAAMSYLDTVLGKYPGMMQPWCDKASLLEAAGDYDGAIAAVQQALDIFDARFAGVDSPPPTLLDRRLSRLLQ